MSNQVFLRFARKPTHIQDVKAAANDLDGEIFECEIAEMVELTPFEYNVFTRQIYKNCHWLDGKGGYKNNRRQVIAVTSPGRETLYVDPSGNSYARYVGMLTEELLNNQPKEKTMTNVNTKTQEQDLETVTDLPKAEIALVKKPAGEKKPADKKAVKSKEKPKVKSKAPKKPAAKVAKAAKPIAKEAKGESKKDLMRSMLKKGTTVSGLMKALDWQRHSVFGSISTLKKVEKFKLDITDKDGKKFYKIA